MVTLLSRYIRTSNGFFTCWTIDVTFTWQIPGLNVPQFPLGVPKLAKLIILTCHPCSQFSRTSGIWELNTWFGFQESAGGGSASDTCAHISWPVLVSKEIFEGSPPSSSWRTRRFSPGWTQVRGICTWTLLSQSLFTIS